MLTTSLYIALGYLLITSGILYLNRSDLSPLESTPRHYFDHMAPQVSICIPARNEENSVERCIRSAVDQQYPNYEVLILDDQSSDGTKEILHKLSEKFPTQLSILSGDPKPDDWIGKPWACHQLAKKAEGEIIVFIDADTWLEPEAIARLVRTMGRELVDLVTIWPDQKLKSFWENVTIPQVYFTLLTLLPSRYVYRDPTWLPSSIMKSISPFFAAACGQFMAFKRQTYKSIGGHSSVKDKIVEDVALARRIKRQGYKMNMYHGLHTVHCRMYQSAQQLWSGFRKNFLAGFSYNLFLFFGMGFLHLITFVLPLIALPFLFFYGSTKTFLLAITAIILMLIQRVIVNQWFNWRLYHSLFHPVGVIWFQILGIRVIIDRLFDVPLQWKGRKL